MASSIHEVGINIWNSVPAAAQDAKAATLASSSEDALAPDAIKLSSSCKLLGKLAGLEKEALRSQWQWKQARACPTGTPQGCGAQRGRAQMNFGLENSEQ